MFWLVFVLDCSHDNKTIVLVLRCGNGLEIDIARGRLADVIHGRRSKQSFRRRRRLLGLKSIALPETVYDETKNNSKPSEK